jgi:hypothetical protein
LTDWSAWHSDYDDPSTGLAKRLAAVQRRLAEAVDAAPPGEVRVVSMCAGEARDLASLVDHPRRADVRGLAVELDPRNVERARARLEGLAIDVVAGDAALVDLYEPMVPANVVLACGVFGNISDADVERTVRALPSFCAPGAWVLWTRHRREPDLTPAIRSWCASVGLEEVAFDTFEGHGQSVGTARSIVEPPPLARGERLFTFVR